MRRKADIVIIGHRGSRELYPENTVPAFLEAIKSGANGIEMDLNITKDHKIVVIHDAKVSHRNCTFPDELSANALKEDGLKVYSLNYDVVKNIRCGPIPDPEFPFKNSMPIPLLSEVIHSVQPLKRTLNYYLEIKSDENTDNLYHPEPSLFVKLVLQVIFENEIQEHCTVLSFDKRCLKEVRKQAPRVKTGMSMENKRPLKIHLEELGFLPDAIFPHFEEINDALIAFANQNNIQLFPWTVNDEEIIKKMLHCRIDGLITDFPAQVLKLMETG